MILKDFKKNCRVGVCNEDGEGIEFFEGLKKGIYPVDLASEVEVDGEVLKFYKGHYILDRIEPKEV